MTNSKKAPSGQYIHLKEVSELIGVSYRTGQNYAKLMKEHYPEEYEEILQERRKPGQGGRAKKLYKSDPGVDYFANIRDNKPVREPEPIEIVRQESEKEERQAGASRPPIPVDVESFDFEGKEKFVHAICEEYQANEKSIREICYSHGIRITAFMRLLLKNPSFKEMFDEANKIRKHVLIAELEFYENKTLLDKLRPKKIKTTEVVSDLVPEFHEDGSYSMKEVPKGRKVKNKDYVPTPMAIALAGKVRNDLLQEITDGTGEINIPNFEEMTPEERREKIKELRAEIEERKQKRLAG